MKAVKGRGGLTHGRGRGKACNMDHCVIRTSAILHKPIAVPPWFTYLFIQYLLYILCLCNTDQSVLHNEQVHITHKTRNTVNACY